MDYDLFGEPIADTTIAFDTTDTDTGTSAPDPAETAAPGPTLWGYDTEAVARQPETGANVTLFAAAGPRDTLIFVNQIKAAWPWFARDGDPDSYVLDENGYVAAMDEGTLMVSDILRRSGSLEGIDPFTGTFRIYGQGEGRFSIGKGLTNDILSNSDTAELPTEVIDGETYWYADFDYQPTMDGERAIAKMFLKQTTEGDHIRDLALVHHAHLDEWRDGAVFAPEFVSDLEPYSKLRFMDWMNTNILTLDGAGRAAAPEERYISTDHFTFNTRAGGSAVASSFVSSLPIEHIVELANLTDADPWINLPADITDARVAQLASYTREALEPGLTPFWEYGNEVWNWAHGYKSFTHAARMAADTFEGIDTPSLQGAAEWAAYRGPQLYEIIAEAFEGDAEAPRFVAPMWAYDGPVEANGTLNPNSWSHIYFTAAQAQAMADAPVRPIDIVTDYAVGLYFGGVGSTDARDTPSGWILDTFDTVSEQAEAIAKLQIFGIDSERTLDLGPAALDAPVTGVSWDEVQHLAVGRLVYRDVNAGGLHPMDGLTEVLRFDGTLLQYRGLRAEDWTTVAEFDRAPDRSIAEMVRDITLSGWSFKRDGVVEAGLKGSLTANSAMRLDGHLAYVERLGLEFAGYEGGPHIGEKFGPVQDMYAAYTSEGWSAIVQNAWYDQFDRADLDVFMSHMSHDRFAGGRDNWGAQDYAGQPLEDAPKARLLTETAALGPADGNAPVIDRPIRDGDGGATDGGATDTPVGDAPAVIDGFEAVGWEHDDTWQIDAEGRATQTTGSNAMLSLAERIDVVPGERYRVEMTVAEAGERPGTLRVIATARGDGATRVGEFDVNFVPGERLSFDLDAIPEPHDGLELTIRRGGNAHDALVLSDLSVTFEADAAPVADAPAGIDGFEAVGWEHDDTWQIDAEGRATQTTGSNAMLSLAERIDVVPGERYRVEMTVAEAGERPGTLRVIATARGDGATRVGEFDVNFVPGERLSFDLDAIPEPHDGLELTIRRGGNAHDALVLSDLSVTSEADAAPVADAPAVIDGFEAVGWEHDDTWQIDAEGRATQTTGSNAMLSLAERIDVVPGERYRVEMTVAEAGDRPGTLRVIAVARGDGATRVGEFDVNFVPGERLSFDLDAIPEPHDGLELTIRRGGNAHDALVLSDLSVTPITAMA